MKDNARGHIVEHRFAVGRSLAKFSVSGIFNHTKTYSLNFHTERKVHLGKSFFNLVHGFGAEVQVSRTTPAFVRKLFEIEVPELTNGEVEIKSIAREAGNRTKLSVYSADPNIDPLGACVGAHGARINAVIDELHGEKIDVVRYSDDVFEYIANALSPADVVSVELNNETKSSRVIVPDNKLSLAIGKEGCNVRLAARLTGWKIDVKSESSSEKEEQSKQVHEYTSIFDKDGADNEIDIFEDIETI